METVWSADFLESKRVPRAAVLALHSDGEITVAFKPNRSGRKFKPVFVATIKSHTLRDEGLVTGLTRSRIKHHIDSVMEQAAFSRSKNALCHAYAFDMGVRDFWA